MNQHNPAQQHDQHGFVGVLQDSDALAAAFADQAAQLPATSGPTAGGLITRTENGIVTAQRVDVRRDMQRILADLKTLAGAMGEFYYYHGRAKNKDGSQGEVSGPSIKCANDVARIYGNCHVDVRVQDGKDHWIFYSRFVDYETGYSLTRAFQQRKSQTAGGKMAPDRQLDLTFQIGQSKAIRNVVANALSTLVDYAVEEAKKSIVSRIGKNLDASRQRAIELLDERDVAMERVVRVIGRPPEEWTAYDVAKIASGIKTVEDGMATAEDLWPTNSQNAPEAPPAQGDAPAAPPAQGEKSKTTAKSPKETEPEPKKSEPEPEPKPEPDKEPETNEKSSPASKQSAKEEAPPAPPEDDAGPIPEALRRDKSKKSEDPEPDGADGDEADVATPRHPEQYAEFVAGEFEGASNLDELSDAFAAYSDDVQKLPKPHREVVDAAYGKRFDELDKVENA